MVGGWYQHLCYHAFRYHLHDHPCQGIYHRLDVLSHVVDDSAYQFPCDKVLSALFPQTECNQCIRGLGAAFQPGYTPAGVVPLLCVHDSAHGHGALSAFFGSDGCNWH